VIHLIPWLAVGVAFLVDFPFVSVSLAYVLLALVAILNAPTVRSTPAQVAVVVAAVAMLAILYLWPFDSGYYQEWLEAMGWWGALHRG
jgi:hypothetical protein